MEQPSVPFTPTAAQRAQRRAFETLLATPSGLRHRLGGGHVVDGGQLDPDIALGLKALGATPGMEIEEKSVPEARAGLAEEAWMFSGPQVDVESLRPVTIDGAAHGAAGDIPALLYLPRPNPVTVQGKFANAAHSHARSASETQSNPTGTAGPTQIDARGSDAIPSGAQETGQPAAADRSGRANPETHDSDASASSNPASGSSPFVAPASTTHESAALPLVVYFHGGGWVLGSAQTHDAVARSLCALGEVAVLNIDYRLAPEHVFPAAVDDAVAAFRWAHANAAALGVDPNRIAVSGDSAGGNLAAVVAQTTARDGSPTPAMQVLFVPVTDATLPRSHSYETFSEGYFLTRANMDWYEANYLAGSPTPPENLDELRADPRISPLLARDLPELAQRGLAPAYVAVAGFDPLRDEGIAYARKLADAGVPTTLRVHTDAVHPFINLQGTDLGRRCMADAVGALRMGLRVA